MHSQERWIKFWYYLLLGGPSPRLLAAFTLGLLVVGLLGNLAYDGLTGQLGAWTTVWPLPVAIVVFVTLAYICFQLELRHGSRLAVAVDESRLAPTHAGVIWLFGPGRFDHLLCALAHHRQDGGAGHCWLVMQDSPPLRDAFARLSQALLELQQATQLHPIYIQELSVQAAYHAVRMILERECVEEGLALDAVIADITGGTKPLTAGMVLAALTCGAQMEYVESTRDAEGQVIPGSARVVLVDTDFTLTPNNKGIRDTQ